MHYLLYNNKIRIIFTFIWIFLFSYFLYSWAKDDKTFEVGVAFLALFAPSVFLMIFPSKKDTFLIDTNKKVLKPENIIKHGLDIEYPFIRYNDN